MENVTSDGARPISEACARMAQHLVGQGTPLELALLAAFGFAIVGIKLGQTRLMVESIDATIADLEKRP
jgi:hypothetical protein